MAYYDDRQYAHHDHYPPPDYGQDPYYYGRNRHSGDPRHKDVARHHDRNEGPPGEYGYSYGYDNPPRSSRRSELAQEGVRRSHSMGGHYNDPDYGQSRVRRSKRHGDRYDDRRDTYSPPSSRSPSRRRRKSLSEQALAALGLGSAAAAKSKPRDSGRGRSRGRDHRSYSYSPSPSRGGGRHREKSQQRVAQAVRAALTAGAVEAFRARKEPGDWTGAKGKRVLTAALAAGGTDGLVDRDPSKHSKRHIVESTLAGLAANRAVNGSRSKSHSRSRGRSGRSSHGGVKGLATAGLLATAGKELFDRSRSRPRRRSRSRDGYDSSDSSDSSDRPRRSKKRSKSVTAYITQGMEALGFNDRDSDRDRHRDSRQHRHHRSSRYGGSPDDSQYSDYDSQYRSSPRRGGRHSRDVSRPYYNYNYDNLPTTRARGDEGYGYGSGPHPPPSSSHNHDRRRPASHQQPASDAGNSTDEEQKNKKKLTRDMMVTTGLATVATIHAAHSIHDSMEKHRKRIEMLKEGQITPEEARRRRIKAQLQDTANVGMAALGIQGAISEWKNADGKRRERATLLKESKSRRVSRNRDRAQSMSYAPPRTMYPDEIEENYSPSETRSRSMGRSSSIY